MPYIALRRAEVTTITVRGFWIDHCGEELYVAFARFPVFEHATVAQLARVVTVSPGHLYWPLLGADVCIETLRPHASCLH